MENLEEKGKYSLLRYYGDRLGNIAYAISIVEKCNILALQAAKTGDI